MYNNPVSKFVARLRFGIPSLQVAALLVMSACGGPDAPTTESGAETTTSTPTAGTDTASNTTNTGNRKPNRVVNALSFEATGDVNGVVESNGTDLMLAGGCVDSNVIGMSFTRGQITDKDLFQVRLRTADSVPPGETGTFPLSELGWYNGQFKPENLPTEANILVPDSYRGSGTLTLTRHDGGGLNGRMAGSVEGTVAQESGDNQAAIKVSFDINLGCRAI